MSQLMARYASVLALYTAVSKVDDKDTLLRVASLHSDARQYLSKGNKWDIYDVTFQLYPSPSFSPHTHTLNKIMVTHVHNSCK